MTSQVRKHQRASLINKPEKGGKKRKVPPLLTGVFYKTYIVLLQERRVELWNHRYTCTIAANILGKHDMSGLLKRFILKKLHFIINMAAAAAATGWKYWFTKKAPCRNTSDKLGKNIKG